MRPARRPLARTHAHALVLALSALHPVSARAQVPPDLPPAAPCARPLPLPRDAQLVFLEGFFARSATEAWALGEHAIARFDGERWSVLATGLTPPYGARAVGLWVGPGGTPWVALAYGGERRPEHCGGPQSTCELLRALRPGAGTARATVPVAMRFIAGRWEVLEAPASAAGLATPPQFATPPFRGRAVLGTADDDVWIEAEDRAAHWDGRTMTLHPALPRALAASLQSRADVSGLAHPRLRIEQVHRFAGGAWVSGRPAEGYAFSAVALYRDDRWRTFESSMRAHPLSLQRVTRGAPIAVLESVQRNGARVGGTRRSWDGQTLRDEVLPPLEGIAERMVEGPDGALWTVTHDGNVLRRRAGVWESVPGAALHHETRGLAAVGPDEAWLVALDGTLRHYRDGRLDAPSPEGPTGVQRVVFASPREGWALTERGLLRWQGTSWTTLSLPWEGFRTRSIAASSDGLFVLAEAHNQIGRVFRYDGRGWRAMPALVNVATRADEITRAADTDLWLSWSGQPSAHWDGHCWEQANLTDAPSPDAPALLEVSSDRPPLDVFGGDRAVLVHRGL